MAPRGRTRRPADILASLSEVNEQMQALLGELARSRRTPDGAAIEQLPVVVRAAREQNGLTQKELAEKAGLGVRTIVALERGASGISLQNLRKVLDTLGIGLRLH